MYEWSKNQVKPVESVTFACLGMKESDIEEILRRNINMLCDDEESMLIVGQQVQNEKNGRSDLMAIDNNGDIVLIEIKRDKLDMAYRREAFEFQAIRYAANCATIKSTEELIQNVFAPYIEKHFTEFQEQELTSCEIAKRKLVEFLEDTKIAAFNSHQRIFLVASEFDDQTLSAVAWLNSNQVDISCFQICPYKLNDTFILDVKKVLPLLGYDDYYVNVAKKDCLQKDRKKDITRSPLPKIKDLIAWRIVEPGSVIVAKGKGVEATLTANGEVETDDGILTIQQWLKNVFAWSAISTYDFSVDKKTGKTLSQLREEYMKNKDDVNNIEGENE